MIKYTSKDIIERAEELADLQNSDFISDKEKSALLNEAWSVFYQKILNANDKAFMKQIAAYDGMMLPYDFYQLSALYIQDSKEQIFKINSAQKVGYDIIGNTLHLSDNYDNVSVVFEYFPQPRTLFYSSGTREQKSFPTKPKIIIDNDLYIDANSNLYSYSNNSLISSLTLSGLIFQNGVISVSGDTVSFSDFGGNVVSTRTDIPFVVKGNKITYDIIRTEEDLSDYMLYLTDKDGEQVYFLGKDMKVYNKNFEEVLTLSGSETLYCRGDGLYISETDQNFIKRVLGSVVESFPLSLWTFCAFVDETYCITSFNSNYYKESYGFNSELDYPGNIYFTVLAYALAVSFKLKQNGDATALNAKYEEAISQFYDSLPRDDNGNYVMKNVYTRGRAW